MFASDRRSRLETPGKHRMPAGSLPVVQINRVVWSGALPLTRPALPKTATSCGLRDVLACGPSSDPTAPHRYRSSPGMKTTSHSEDIRRQGTAQKHKSPVGLRPLSHASISRYPVVSRRRCQTTDPRLGQAVAPHIERICHGTSASCQQDDVGNSPVGRSGELAL